MDNFEFLSVAGNLASKDEDTSKSSYSSTMTLEDHGIRSLEGILYDPSDLKSRAFSIYKVKSTVEQMRDI